MSTFIDDGGQSNDFGMVHSAEMVDKQSDELEILKEIPPNTTKNKSQGKKLQNQSEGAVQVICRNNKRRYEPLSSTRLTLTPQFKRYGNRVWLEEREKRNKFILVNKESPCNRRWEDMDHEILIQIMKRYSLCEWGRTNFVVCKSWLSAFLDFLFPPGQVLDLRVLDDNKSVVCEYRWRAFYRYLLFNLNRRSPDSYTTIILSKYVLPGGVYENIAQRLPLLKSFVSPEKMIHLDRFVNPFTTSMIDGHHHGFAYKMCPHMQNLERVVCHVSMLSPFIWWCKSIRSLTLTGYNGRRGLDNMRATSIAEGFPHLEHLSISFLTISLNGLKSILNGHPKLHCLDLQHSRCIDEKINKYLPLIPHKLPWPEEIIANVKTVLTCPGKSCAKCRLDYGL